MQYIPRNPQSNFIPWEVKYPRNGEKVPQIHWNPNSLNLQTSAGRISYAPWRLLRISSLRWFVKTPKPILPFAAPSVTPWGPRQTLVLSQYQSNIHEHPSQFSKCIPNYLKVNSGRFLLNPHWEDISKGWGDICKNPGFFSQIYVFYLKTHPFKECTNVRSSVNEFHIKLCLNHGFADKWTKWFEIKFDFLFNWLPNISILKLSLEMGGFDVTLPKEFGNHVNPQEPILP